MCICTAGDFSFSGISSRSFAALRMTTVWRKGPREGSLEHPKAKNDQNGCRPSAVDGFLPHGFFYFIEPAGTLKDFAGLGAVGGANDAVFLHQINQVSGAAIADAQAPLQQGSGGFSELDDQAHGIFEERIVFVAPLATFAAGARGGFFLWRFEEVLLILGRSLGAPEFYGSGDLLLRNERRVQALHASGAGGQVEHVAAAEQRFGAIGVENGA